MKIIKLNSLNEFQFQELFKIWNAEYPEILNYKNLEDFKVYLHNLIQPNHYLVINQEDQIFGWYFDFERENQRWFGIILSSKLHGRGLGRRLLEIGKKTQKELCGWVINEEKYLKSDGSLYKSPLGFYQKNGFGIDDRVALETEKFKAIKISWKSSLAGKLQ